MPVNVCFGIVNKDGEEGQTGHREQRAVNAQLYFVPRSVGGLEA
jgi:hypothetical protein